MRRLLKFLIGLCLVILLAVAALLWRLDRGPVSLAFAKPVLQLLIDRGSPYAISFSDPKLVWLREADEVALQVRDVEARTPEGELVAAAPSVRATVAVPPLLLDQRLQLAEVQLDLPSIGLTRDENGKLLLTFDRRLASIPLGETTGGGGLGAFLANPERSRTRVSQILGWCASRRRLCSSWMQQRAIVRPRLMPCSSWTGKARSGGCRSRAS